MLDAIISALIQLVILTTIPFIWWIATARKSKSFFYWIGLRKIEIANKKIYLIATISLLVISVILGTVVLPKFIETSYNAVTSTESSGFSAVFTIVIFSYIKTGLAEEIFFRGFIAKRLINKFGFDKGNFIQGLIFGMLHGLLFFAITGPVIAGMIILITGFAGWANGWFNEKQSGGSILSSWLLHGTSNVVIALISLIQ